MRKDTAGSRTALSAALVVLTCVASAFVATPAQAANFGATACGGTPRSCVSLANNIWHVVRWEGDEDIRGIVGSLFWAVENSLDNPTDMIAYRDENDDRPDVWAWDENWGNNGAVAWVECPNPPIASGGTGARRWCLGQIARFNANYENADFVAEHLRRRIACHELGHTVGLRHVGGNSCMFTPAAGAGSPYYSAHDINHINGTY